MLGDMCGSRWVLYQRLSQVNLKLALPRTLSSRVPAMT
jgi:hypothetical protein